MQKIKIGLKKIQITLKEGCCSTRKKTIIKKKETRGTSDLEPKNINPFNGNFSNLCQYFSEANNETKTHLYDCLNNHISALCTLKTDWQNKLKCKVENKDKREPTIQETVSMLDDYILNCKLTQTRYENVKKKPRRPNFPEDISENLVKYMIMRKTGYLPTWKPGAGDLSLSGKRFEVKCFSSKGPSSFGPTEKWDEIYFLDAIDYLNRNFKCYKVQLSSQEFQNLQITNTETYFDKCKTGVRPRISFSKLQQEFPPSKISIIFEGDINQLL